MPWIAEKPRVFKDASGHWQVELEHQNWVESTWFDTWDHAMEHALWIGLNAGVWEIP